MGIQRTHFFILYSISTDSSGDFFEHNLDDALNKGAYVVLNTTKVLTTGAATAGKTCMKPGTGGVVSMTMHLIGGSQYSTQNDHDVRILGSFYTIMHCVM